MSFLWSRYRNLSHAARSAFTVVFTVLLIGISIGVVYLLVIHAGNSAAVAQAKAVAAQVNQHDLCLATNKENAKQILLWQYIIRLSPPHNQQQVQLDQQFEAYLYQVFKSETCS